MKDEIIIPEFSREDYTETSRPYEWLWEHRGNNFLLKQLKTRMSEKALSVGVRGFIGIFNEFQKSMNERQGMIQGRVTEFEGQPLELECGEYICEEPNVTMEDRLGFVQIICRHPIMPVRRLVNIDSGEEQLEIAYKRDRTKTWRLIVVEKETIASSTKILTLAAVGIFVNSDNAKAL